MTPTSRPIRVQPPASMGVEIQIMGADFFEVAHTRDISVGGIGMWVPRNFVGCSVFAPIKLLLTLPTHESFAVSGIIRHKTTAETGRQFVGVEFTDLDEDHRQAITEYITRCREETPELSG